MRRIVWALPLVLMGCGSGIWPGSNAATRAAAADGATLYAVHCAACHGADAWGAGPESLGLGTPPPDLTTLAARNDGVFPEAYVSATISGKTSTDDPDAAMPGFAGDTESEEADTAEVQLTSADIDALTAYLASLQVR